MNAQTSWCIPEESDHAFAILVWLGGENYMFYLIRLKLKHLAAIELTEGESKDFNFINISNNPGYNL